MDCNDAPDLDEITLLRLPPPDAAERIKHLDPPDEPEPEPEEEPWWRQETGR